MAQAQGIQGLGNRVAPWWNPPFYAWVFAPLSLLPYPTAILIWRLVNLAACVLAAVLLTRMLPRDGRTWPLVLLLVVVSMPSLYALTHAQNSGMSLLIVTAAVVAWRKRRGVLAGAILGLLFYKPQLAMVLAVVLVMDLRLPALGGLAITACLLAGATALQPGALADFLHTLPINLDIIQAQQPYPWDRHVTFRAFWRLLLQGKQAGPISTATTVLATLCIAALGAGLLTRILAHLRLRGPADPVISATILAAPLLMPFYFDYDLLLLAVPAVLLASELSPDRWLVRTWIGLYAVLFVNPMVGSLIRVNLAVVLLAMLAVMHARGLLWRRHEA